MSARTTIQAIKAGKFVPFPNPQVGSNLKTQLREVTQALSSEALADLLYCLIAKNTDLPRSLVPSERRFFQQVIR